MITVDQKHEIVRSLNRLDADQSEKVLDFIRSLAERNADSPEEIKRRALREINKGLRRARLWI